jgi:hypothetical protein
MLATRVSSKPVTVRSRGTVSPRRNASVRQPAASSLLLANMAVGIGPAVSSSIAAARRPPSNVKPLATVLPGDFGISDEALLDVVTGMARPEGKPPFELPSSMQAVRAQKPDLPSDSTEPLYRFGYGLSYSR